MSYFMEPYILFVLGCIFFRDSLTDSYAIQFILIYLIIVSLFILGKNKMLRIILHISAIVLATFIPDCLGFLPACIYFLIYEEKKISALCYLIPFFVKVTDSYQASDFLFLALVGLSIYIATVSKKRDDLTKQVKTLRDNAVEHEIALKSQNARLLESQNDQIYIATLQERNRIAREIHDNVGHMLSSSILQIGALLAICKDDTMKPLLSTLKDTLNLAMNNIRSSVHDLHDESVDMKNSIEQLCNEFHFCPISLTYDAGKIIPKEIKYSFISITREALNNIIKHSDATKVEVMVKEHPGFFQLLIEDNGKKKGHMDLSENKSTGIGLTNMQDRVKALNGIIHIDTEKGYRILISIPK